MKRLLCVGILAVCGFLFAGCSKPAEPETTAEESIEEQEAMIEAERQEAP